MTAYYSDQYSDEVDFPTTLSESGGTIRMFHASYTLDVSEVTIAAADTVQMFRLPAGYSILCGQLTTSVAAGDVLTLDLGVSTDVDVLVDGWDAEAWTTGTALSAAPFLKPLPATTSDRWVYITVATEEATDLVDQTWSVDGIMVKSFE